MTEPSEKHPPEKSTPNTPTSQKTFKKTHNIPEKFLEKSSVPNEGSQSLTFKDFGPKLFQTSSSSSSLNTVQKSSESIAMPQSSVDNSDSLSTLNFNNNFNNNKYQFGTDVHSTKGVKRSLQLSPSAPVSPTKKINLFGSKGQKDLDLSIPTLTNPNPNPNPNLTLTLTEP
jgi:hypothetical protein